MMPKPPSLAKITRPRVRGVLARERLFSHLDNHPVPPVFWVTGPPGCGKTTLVSSYIQERKLSALWYRLDGGDSDPASFFYYLGLAGKKAAPRKKKPLPLLTPEYRQGLSVFTRNFFRDLFGRLKAPFLLVFGDYHEISGKSALHEVIRNGLSEVPDGIRVVMLSRSEPPSSLSRMRANGTIRLIGWDQMRMTLIESRDLIRMRMDDGKGSRLKEEDIRRLHEGTEGWVKEGLAIADATGIHHFDLVMRCNGALGAIFGGDPAAGRLTDKIMAFYQVPFLRDAGKASWVMPVRERVRGGLQRSLLRRGEYLAGAGRHEAAVAVYQKGMEIDGLAEVFCSGLMKCYIALGRRDEVQMIYHRYRRRLMTRLGERPFTAPCVKG